MNNLSIDEQLRAYYSSKMLSPNTLIDLQSKIAAEQTYADDRMANSRFRFNGLWPRWIFGLQFAVIVALSIFLVVGYSALDSRLDQTKYGNPAALVKAVAREIAMNHNKHLKIEFPALTMAELQTEMGKLDFVPLFPGRLSLSKFSVLGARYCSIQGNLAAQIKLVDGTGKLYTLYETRLVESLVQLPESNLEIGGLHLTLWHERGLFMGLASPPA